MKTLLALSFGLTALAAVAQTNAPAPTVPGVPEGSLGWLTMFIVAATPIIVAGLKKLIPQVPTVILPFAAPAIGLALSQITAWVTGHDGSLIGGAILGALGLWLREASTQVQQRLAGDKSTAETSTIANKEKVETTPPAS